MRSAVISLALLSAAHFFIDLYSSALAALQPILVDQLQLSLKQAGILGGLLVLSSSVVQPCWGYLSDRFRTRTFSVAAPAVAGIFISCMGIAPSYFAALALAVAGGAGIASFHPQASAWATAGLQTHKSRWMAVFISSGTLGMAVGPTFFSALLSRLGPQGAYWGAIPGVLMTIALIALLPLPPASSSGKSKRLDFRGLKAVWKPMTVLYFLVFIRSIIQITFAQLLPLYLHRERGFSYTDASLALSFYLGFGAIGGFLGGHLADRFGGRTVILFSMIGSVPFLAMFFLTNGIAAMAGLVLSGFILLFTVPVNVVMAQQLAPEQAGTVSALMMGFAWGMAGLIFIPLTGALGDAFSMHSALFALTIFPVIGYFLALRLPRNI